MKEKLERIYLLFSNYAENKDAKVCVNNDLCQCIVLDHQRILTYQFPDRDTSAGFLLMEPLDLDKEISFAIDKKTKMFDFFSVLVHLDTIKDYHVRYDEKEDTQNLVEAIFNDFETKAVLNQYFDKRFEVYFENNTLSIVANYACDGDFSFNVMTVDLLNQMNLLFDEIKKSMLFHVKRVF